MKIKTKDLIKVLPFDEAFKADLLGGYDNFDPDQKFNIDRILWNTYYALYDLKLEENTNLALLRAKDGQETLDKEFYKRVKEQTDQEMQGQVVETKQTVDLTEARKAMETIIREIQASKIKN